MSASDDPRAWFPAFYANPAIRALAEACRWTVSGRLGDLEDPEGEPPEIRPTHKAPIDMRELLDNGRVRGAWATDDTCLVTLGELTTSLPTAANAAFHLQAQSDGLLLIDIEPSCPPQIRAHLLQLPGILYSEVSMSGRGVHLLVRLPPNFDDFPVAAHKSVLRETNGWYELLLDHWVTFTRQPVPELLSEPVPGAQPPTFASVAELYAELAETATAGADVASSAVDTTTEAPPIPHATAIVTAVAGIAHDQLRTPQEFNNDISRWEFSTLARLYGWLRTDLSEYAADEVTFSTNDMVWLLYLSAVEVLPHRPKHDQRRNGRPFLLDRAAALVAARGGGVQPAHQENDQRYQQH